MGPDNGPVASGSFEICLLKTAKHQNMFIKPNQQEFVHTVMALYVFACHSILMGYSTII
jgi:hypothetical protein